VFEMWMRSFDLLVNDTEHKFEKCGSLYSRESYLINWNWNGCKRRWVRWLSRKSLGDRACGWKFCFVLVWFYFNFGYSYNIYCIFSSKCRWEQLVRGAY